ncbi:hypothetical protein QUA92_36285, partial [Microcoleus sp. F8-C1]
FCSLGDNSIGGFQVGGRIVWFLGSLRLGWKARFARVCALGIDIFRSTCAWTPQLRACRWHARPSFVSSQC